MSRSTTRGPLVLVALLILSTAPAAAQWPQWRGPEGLGVSIEARPLPESWDSEGAGVRWRTTLPGEGISSPIASRGRVFVTTAYEGPRDSLLRASLRGALVVLAVVFLVLAARGRRQGRAADGMARWDVRVVLTASFLVVLVALAMAVKPDEFASVGNPGRAWRLGGGVGLLGLAAAFGWLRRSSPARLAGAALVVVGAFLLVDRMPPGPLGPAVPSKWLPSVVLPLAAALWYLVSFRRARREPLGGAGGRRFAMALGVTLTLTAALVFVPGNFLSGLQRAVVCLDLDSGEVLWTTPVMRAPAEQKWEKSSHATPTPATDGELVYAYFGHGLAGVDFDGRVHWVERLPGYAQHTRYGAGASPVLAASSVIVVHEEEVHQGGPPSWIAAFDKQTGRRRWRVEPPGARDSYTTPLVLPSGSTSQLLTPSWESLVAYDPATGRELWSHAYPMQQMVASMARSETTLAVTGGVYGEKSLRVVQVGDGGSEPELVWQTGRSVADISSPVIYDGMLFTLTTSGIMTCYEAATGEVLWKQRLDGEFFASLVAGDGKVYAVNIEGVTMVIAAAPEFELIAANELGEEVYSSPALAEGCLLIRTATGLHCIDGGPGSDRRPDRSGPV